MLAHPAPATGQLASEGDDVVRAPARTGLLLQRLIAFVGALSLVLVYALRGGSYDLVVFQEHGLVIWWVLAVALALGLIPRARPGRETMLLLGALLLYALWTGLSLIWTQSSERSTEELARVLDYAGVVALLSFTLDRRTWRAGAAGLALGAMVVCVLAVGTRLSPSVFGTDQIDRAFHIDRMSYPFGYWNAVGAWAAMSTAIGLAWSAHDSSRLRSALALGLVPVAVLVAYLSYSRAAIGGVALAVIAILAVSRSRLRVLLHTIAAGAGAALVVAAAHRQPQIAHATGTRGAGTVFGALLVSAAVCAATAFWTGSAGASRWRIRRATARPLAALGAAVVLIAAGAVGPHLARRAWHSFTRTSTVKSSTLSTNPTARLGSLSGSRYPLWKVTLKAFDAHPFDGIGAGTFEFWWNRHATDAEFVRDAHNLWLQTMAELGAPGLLLIIAVAGSALAVGVEVRRRVRRTMSAGIAAAFVSAFIVFLLHASVDWMWESTAVTVLALAGVAAVGARGTVPGRLRWPVRLAAVAVAVLAGLAQLPGLISTAAIRRSQAAEKAGHPSSALAWARTAVSAEPWSAS